MDRKKYFATFPYPYMNGALHLGHAFSLSKAEFAVAFKRLQGYKGLMPMGFHCTGMPIKACADKLDREITQFGNPPVFPKDDGDKKEEETAEGMPLGITSKQDNVENAEPDKFKSKKSKAASKTSSAIYQWQIMQSLGLSDSEIVKFRDPYHWLQYFPLIAKSDLKAFGLGCDWRRSFITTDMNPFYDSFVRWQLQMLKDQGKIVKDMRYTIFSPLDKQPCADHDRASGEGVLPQEYTLIKMQVKSPLTGKLKTLETKRVFLAAATLRPETMYGQTNAWVLPDGRYGAFEISDEEVFIVTERASLNLAYQHLSRVPLKPTSLLDLTGHDLIGVPLVSPLAFNSVIYALPMLTILTDKGTGIVTSVPSDSPDDYMALSDLKTKPALRAKFGVKDEWVLPFDLIPIINIPEFGDKAAEKVCIDLKIKSQNDKEKLAEAKKQTYLKGFTEGSMLVGEFKGMKVQEAKPLIKKLLIERGEAVIYSEPEKKVMSRSGDECVVALTDQWYLTYGEDEWKTKAEECLSEMNLYSDETRHGFEHTLGWLNQWACSRSFGLGTRLPWDPQFLVESLSDSTIYMAYYTIAHILQNGNLFGDAKGVIKPEQMTSAVWNYVFGRGPIPRSSIPLSILQRMRREFEFWYPVDLRVSGKDLINNHLTFSIYNHTALFTKDRWPKAFRCNGMIMLNSEKMSKSTGNFCTLKQSIEEFSADATRFALADAGDTTDDANFVFETANAAILRLTKELTWIEEVFAAQSSLRTGPASTFADRVFDNEINIAISITEQNYNSLMFRDALKSGFYDLQTARDEYRLSCGLGGMRADLVLRFIDVQTRLLTPICPHYAEYVWKDLLNKNGFAVVAGWPAANPPNPMLQRANKYLQDVIIDIRKVLQKQLAGPKKGKKSGADVVETASLKPVAALIFVGEKYEGWKEECLKILQAHYDYSSQAFSPHEEIMAVLKDSTIGQSINSKQVLKQCMPFIKFKKDETLSVGPQALELKLPFEELQVLEENVELIKRQLGLLHVAIYSITDADAVARAGAQVSHLRQSPPFPGNPVAVFVADSTLIQDGVGNIHI
ncbi:hypothetical protein O6H91_04G044500 [Diphasiastrum complanatum]|nr:hypothetical protein O6H91_04G044500 [Diphasiastrum complanatum]